MSQNDIIIYEVLPTNKFNDDVKFYIRKKKFTKLPDDIADIIDDLPKGKFSGNIIPGLKLPDGKQVYKARAANSNTNVGQSNGYRLIYYVEEKDKLIFLVTIYYKKEDNRIPSDNQIKEFVEKYN